MIFIEHGNISDTVTRIMRDAFFYVYICSFAYSYLDYTTFKIWLKNISIILAFLVIAQELVYILTGYLIPGFFLNATVSQTTSARQIYNHIQNFANHSLNLIRFNLSGSFIPSGGAQSCKVFTCSRKGLGSYLYSILGILGI